MAVRKFLEKLRGLTRMERGRVELTLARIHNNPPMMFLFNLVLVGISALAILKSYAMSLLETLGISTSHLYRKKSIEIPEDICPRPLTNPPTVLLVVEETIPQCFHYRVEQKLRQLEQLGYAREWISWRKIEETRQKIHFVDIVIFYRAPGFPEVLNTIRYARALNKIVMYDIDDLVFDRQQLENKFKGATGQLPARERDSMFRGADLYRMAIQQCSFAIASTESLREQLGKLLGMKNCFVLPNGVGDELNELARRQGIPKEKGVCDIFYGSGTKTHDEDFELVAEPLEKILLKHGHVRIVIVGYLTLPEALKRYQDRIVTTPPIDFASYLSVVSLADINIAPLEAGVFADCKSEIKWLEASVFQIPSVVSRTTTYERMIEHEVNGLLAENPDDWYLYLDRLITDAEYRRDIGESAQQQAMRLYSMKKLAARFNEVLAQTKLLCLQQGIITDNRPKVGHIMFVNTLYPPDALGGATVVMRNIVAQLRDSYRALYRVSVVTYDVMAPKPYLVREYTHDGIDITAISAPPGPEMDWTYKDDQIGAVFEKLLRHRKPDLVHFHSIQRLTGSVAEACERAGIPFVVTVHDAWWLSDHQFLLDKTGKPVNDLQRNPLIAATTSAHIRGTLKRTRYLIDRLQNAKQIFAVSEYQADFYRRNGIDNVAVNRNGVDMIPNFSRVDGNPTHVRMGYVGGVCAHKGFYFLKQAVSEINLSNISITIVDFMLNAGVQKSEDWGRTKATYVPPFPYDERAQFYAQIDVLLAPSMWPESFGLVTREASLLGLWVVASDAGGLAEDLENGKNAYVFPKGDLEALKLILQKIDEDPEKYTAVIRPPESGASITSVEQQVRGLDAHYRQLLSYDAKDKHREIIDQHQRHALN